jgi:hypothetical protein
MDDGADNPEFFTHFLCANRYNPPDNPPSEITHTRRTRAYLWSEADSNICHRFSSSFRIFGPNPARTDRCPALYNMLHKSYYFEMNQRDSIARQLFDKTPQLV